MGPGWFFVHTRPCYAAPRDHHPAALGTLPAHLARRARVLRVPVPAGHFRPHVAARRARARHRGTTTRTTTRRARTRARHGASGAVAAARCGATAARMCVPVPRARPPCAGGAVLTARRAVPGNVYDTIRIRTTVPGLRSPFKFVLTTIDTLARERLMANVKYFIDYTQDTR